MLSTETFLSLIIGVSLVFGPWCRHALGFGDVLDHDLSGQLGCKGVEIIVVVDESYITISWTPIV